MALIVSKGKLKAKMLEIFRQIEADGSELIVTDFGKPVLRITPIKDKAPVEALFYGLQGQVAYLEDVNAPTIAEWGDA